MQANKEDPPTATIPIFYMHPGDKPWCLNPACRCHQGDDQLKQLLLSVIARDLKLRQVVNGTLV